MRNEVYAYELAKGSLFDFQPVKGDPKTHRFKVLRNTDEGLFVAEIGDDGKEYAEQKFNEYAYVTIVRE